MKLLTMPYLKLTSALSSLTLLFCSTMATADTQFLSVSVKPLSSIFIQSKQSSPASVVSLNTSVISAEITGRAVKIYAETGDMVEAKQKLVELDCRSYTFAKKQAEAKARQLANQAKKQAEAKARQLVNQAQRQTKAKANQIKYW